MVPPGSRCPPGWFSIESSQKCFYLEEERKQLPASRETCSRLKSEIFSPDSFEEFEAIVSEIKSMMLMPSFYWLNLKIRAKPDPRKFPPNLLALDGQPAPKWLEKNSNVWKDQIKTLAPK